MQAPLRCRQPAKAIQKNDFANNIPAGGIVRLKGIMNIFFNAEILYLPSYRFYSRKAMYGIIGRSLSDLDIFKATTA